MLDAEWNLTEVAEVALVEVSVHNPTAVDRRVRVENRLDGPTLPPRTGGVPEAGWDADGYAGVVPAGERLRLGFASPATPTEPPVAVEDAGRADDEDGAGSAGGADAVAAVRLLDDGAPPADALPAAGGAGDEPAVGTDASEPGRAEREGPADATDAGEPEQEVGEVEAATDEDVAASVGRSGVEPERDEGDDAVVSDPSVGNRTVAATAGGPATNGTADSGTHPPTGAVAEALDDGHVRREADVPASDPGGPRSEGGEAGPDGARSGIRADAEIDTGGGADPDGEAGSEPGGGEGETEVPPPVDAWLSDVAGRVEHGERLTGASVVEAAAVLDERGGLAAVEALPDRLAADEAALRALADRAAALADRAAATDVPLAALRRLS